MRTDSVLPRLTDRRAIKAIENSFPVPACVGENEPVTANFEVQNGYRLSIFNCSGNAAFGIVPTLVVTLPESIDPDSIVAELVNGVLQLTVSKKQEVQPKRIKIR
ncbi:MAG: Hsp20 family protein [Pirellulales bacterium]|nr:Hsp20 family protein [Pirellulales bacterium]